MEVKASKPFCCFPQHPAGSTHVPSKHKACSRSLGALPCCSGCQAWGHAATGAGAAFDHHWQGSWFLPKLFMSFPRLAALCPTESSRPFTLCFPTCITDLGITLPALLAVSLALGASLGLFVLISNFPAKSLVR